MLLARKDLCAVCRRCTRTSACHARINTFETRFPIGPTMRPRAYESTAEPAYSYILFNGFSAIVGLRLTLFVYIP